MQTNPADEQSKIIRWSESPWNQSGRKREGLWRKWFAEEPSLVKYCMQSVGIHYVDRNGTDNNQVSKRNRQPSTANRRSVYSPAVKCFCDLELRPFELKIHPNHLHPQIIKCTEVVKFGVKFPQAVYKISRSQTASIYDHGRAHAPSFTDSLKQNASCS